MGSGADSTGRRSLLRSVALLSGISAVGGARAAEHGPLTADSDSDGIPDHTKRSLDFHETLSRHFGPQFEGLEMGRADLLIDVRHVGETTISRSTQQTIVDLFRSRDIHAQWLEYPTRYDLESVASSYGTTVKELLWGWDSFYSDAVEPELQDVAVQLIVVPGTAEDAAEGRIYSHWMGATGGGAAGYVNGFSLGNRAVVAERSDPTEEARLVFHELAHLVLCHDADPENTGVMGTAEELDLTDREWERFRAGLGNVRDRTGYDFLFRPCLWHENLTSVFA